MKKMPPKGQRWLKIIHLTLAAIWLSSGFALVLLALFLTPEKGNAIYGTTLAMKFIDDFLIIPAANGCLLTGLIYGIWTHWGFFKHRWVILKWIITLYGIIVGTIWLGPWMNEMAAITGQLGNKALTNADYLSIRQQNIFWGALQVATLFVALGVSVLKPWKKKPAA